MARVDATGSALATGVHELIGGAGLVAVLVIGVVGVDRHSLSGLLLAAAVFLFLGARESIAALPGAAQRARACAAAAARVRENLLIADPGAADDALWDVRSIVELDAWAAALPHELVGQFGERVSGGQRRRIALARALLSPAAFLILDEPTAHLDDELAARLVSRLRRRCRDRGVLLITHGGAGLVGFDRVLRLAGGRLTGLASDDACGIDTARIDAENGPDAQPAVPSSVRA